MAHFLNTFEDKIQINYYEQSFENLINLQLAIRNKKTDHKMEDHLEESDQNVKMI